MVRFGTEVLREENWSKFTKKKNVEIWVEIDLNYTKKKDRKSLKMGWRQKRVKSDVKHEKDSWKSSKIALKFDKNGYKSESPRKIVENRIKIKQAIRCWKKSTKIR